MVVVVMVYENRGCSPVRYETTVIPLEACCPICGEYQERMI
jgi:hypothetical protein